jgi:hypothetical protein
MRSSKLLTLPIAVVQCEHTCYGLRCEMLRRAVLVAPRATNARAYTDFRHHEFVHIKSVTIGIYAIIVVGWLGFFAWGSVWWESNRVWKRAVLQSWHRRMPKGYLWADQIPAEPVKNIYRNIPSGAE